MSNNSSKKDKRNISTPKKRSRNSPEQLESQKREKRVSMTNQSRDTLQNNDETLLRKFGTMLDEKFLTIATKMDVKAIDDKLENIISENKNLQKEIVELKQENKKVKENLEFLMRKLKSKNLIITGLNDVREGEDNVKVIKELCVRALEMNEPIIDRVYKIGQGQSFAVEFIKQSDVQAVLKNARKLKNTGIWINRDLTFNERQNKKKLMEVRKKILEVEKEERVVVRDGYLIFKKKKFYWDEEKGITARNEEDMQIIQECLDHKSAAASAHLSSKIN